MSGSSDYSGDLDISVAGSDVGTWDTSAQSSYSVTINDGESFELIADDGTSGSGSYTAGSDATATLTGVSIAGTGTNQVGLMNMTVMQSPGANEIDLEGASVEYIGPDGEATLGYAETAAEGNFAVEGTTDPDNTVPVLTSRQDRFTITVELVDDDNSDLRNLQEGEEATVRIVTQSGSQAVTVVNVPQSLSSYSDEDAVEL
nr:hypothetical protein [Natronoarchaeum rubrum]